MANFSLLTHLLTPYLDDLGRLDFSLQNIILITTAIY